MRGAVALPGSEATSRTKGSRWNLGDLVWPAVAVAIPGRGRKARSRSCRGTGEESDEPRSTGEAPEQGRDERRRRAWREGGSVGGMVGDWRCSGRRTGPRILSPSPACGSALRSNLRARPIAPDLRQEPGAGKPHAGICAGGREKSLALPRQLKQVENRSTVKGRRSTVHILRAERVAGSSARRNPRTPTPGRTSRQSRHPRFLPRHARDARRRLGAPSAQLVHDISALGGHDDQRSAHEQVIRRRRRRSAQRAI